MTTNNAAYRAFCFALKFAIAAVLIFAGAWGVAMLTGCGRAKKGVYVPKGTPLIARFDPKSCRYLPDGIRFTCKNPVFDPQVIDARQQR